MWGFWFLCILFSSVKISQQSGRIEIGLIRYHVKSPRQCGDITCDLLFAVCLKHVFPVRNCTYIGPFEGRLDVDFAKDLKPGESNIVPLHLQDNETEAMATVYVTDAHSKSQLTTSVTRLEYYYNASQRVTEGNFGKLTFTERFYCDPCYYGRFCTRRYSGCHPCPICENNGTCQSNGKCRCPEGYSGTKCEVDPCGSNPCLNNGTCQVQGSSYNCFCPQGYIGRSCEMPDPCVSNPCLNGGICSATNSTFICSCPQGFTGSTCERVDCSSITCYNGGSCVMNGTSPSCVCTSGFTGKFCENSSCDSLSCNNGGLAAKHGSQCMCFCPNGYFGTYCEIVAETCASNPCMNGGQCNETSPVSIECTCAAGYSGRYCENAAAKCDRNICRNGGTCYLKDGIFQSCSCPDGYSGPYCETVDPCKTLHCRNNGTCVQDKDTYKCLCTPGYYGRLCNHYNPCNKNGPCVNGGSCHVVNGTSACLCPEEFSGQFCEKTKYNSTSVGTGCSDHPKADCQSMQANLNICSDISSACHYCAHFCDLCASCTAPIIG